MRLTVSTIAIYEKSKDYDDRNVLFLSYDIESRNQAKFRNELSMATVLSNPTQKTKHYQTNQQVKYLHLEAELDMLLQKINALKQRKQLANIAMQSQSTSD